MFTKLFLLILFFVSTNFAQTDSTKILNNFNEFLRYVNKGNGREAINFIDKNSVKYFSKLKEDVLYASKEKIDSLPITTKYYILIIRSFYKVDDLLNITTIQFFEKLVEDGIIGGSPFPKIDFTFSINNDNAKLYIDKIDSTYYLEFHNEDDIWKLDISSMMRLGNIQFEEQIRYGIIQKEDIDKGLKDFLIIITNSNSVDYLWEPLIK